MRVGFLTYGLDRAPTGIGRYAIELLHALRQLPAAPEVLLLTTEASDPHGLWKEFEHYRLPGCRLLPALMTAGNALLGIAAARFGLDLIHDPNGIAPFLGPAGGARRVVTIHDAFAYVHPETHNRLDNWRYRWMLPRAARVADAVLTDSQHSRADLLRFLGLAAAHVTAVPCAINPQFVPVPDNTARRAVLARYGIEGPYLLYVGGINARKNIARLFRAFARVRERLPTVKLVVGGKRQWQTGEIDTVFRELALEGDVVFTGYLDDADLPALYSAAQLFVFPSLYEGFGLPPLEAMACGTPVVTSTASSLPEVVGDAAVLVDPYDVEALEQAIMRVLGDGALRATLRQRGLTRAQHFTWQRTAHDTLQVYHQAIEHGQLARAVRQ